MLFPSLVQDDFLNDVESVIELSKKLPFKGPTDDFFNKINGGWPGERTDCLSVLNTNFYIYFCSKVLKLYYPGEIICFEAELYFQRIPSTFNFPGWIHQDSNQLSAVCYLSNHKDSGTSLYKPKNFYNVYSDAIDKLKKKSYRDSDFSEESAAARDAWNNKFDCILDVPSYRNRVFCFEGSKYHGVKNFTSENTEDDRLTLICFFQKIEGNIKYPAVESRKI
jgi:hypothetical protein